MSTISPYDRMVFFIGDGTIDIDSVAANAFRTALMTAAHLPYTKTHTQWSQVSANEIGAGNGYAAGGQGMTGVSWAESNGLVTWTTDAITWNASGGPITADAAVIYCDAATNDELMFSIDFEGQESAGDGTDFIITPHPSGIFTI